MKHNNSYFITKEYLFLLLAIIISIILIFANESSFLKYLRISGLNTFSILRLDILNLKTNSILREENNYLKERIISLIAQNNRFKEAIIENENLKNLLKIKQDKKFNYIYARVIGLKADNKKDMILINIGSDSGIKKNDPVISINGLVGKITTCGRKMSHVQLISHHKNKIPVFTEKNRIPGIIHPLNINEAELKEITKTSIVEQGENIITSRYSTIYPEGIEIGRVSFVSDSSATIHKIVKIKFSEDLSKLEDVFVLSNKTSLEFPSVKNPEN